jgi:hypothetical protein
MHFRQWSTTTGDVTRAIIDSPGPLRLRAAAPGRGHLRRVLSSYFHYHHDARTHLSLDKDCPRPRAVQLPSTGNNIIAFPQVGGLHHRYERQAA